MQINYVINKLLICNNIRNGNNTDDICLTDQIQSILDEIKVRLYGRTIPQSIFCS